MSTMSEFLGGSGAVNWQRMILQSGTFTAPFAGKYLIAAIGAGGSGAKAALNGAAIGGAAGGVAMEMAYLTAGQVLTLVVGAGGAAVSGLDNAPGINGNAGGNTTVTGTGVALTASGGAGGIQSTATTGTLTAPAGGTATGGDINVKGGSSDSVTLSATGAACGGGAVGIYGFTPPNAVVTPSGSDYGGGSVLGSAGYSSTFAYPGPVFGSRFGAGARYVGDSNYLDRFLQSGVAPANYMIPYVLEGESFRAGNLLCPIGLRGARDASIYAFLAGDAGAGGVKSFTDFCGSGGVYAGGAGCFINSKSGNAGPGGILGGGGGGISTSAANGSYLAGGRGGVGGVVIQFLGA